MRLINYLKDLQIIGKELVCDSAKLKKQLDRVQVELSYTELVTADIKKDIKAYQFQVQPRLDVINELSNKIKKEISK